MLYCFTRLISERPPVEAFLPRPLAILFLATVALAFPAVGFADGVRVPGVDLTANNTLKRLNETQEDPASAIATAQLLLEECLENPKVFLEAQVQRQYRSYRRASDLVLQLFYRKSAQWGLAYQTEYEQVARASFIQACQAPQENEARAEGLRDVARRYPLTVSGCHAALRAAQLFLECGQVHRSSRVLRSIPFDALPEKSAGLLAEEIPEVDIRSEWVRLGCWVAALEGDRASFQAWSRCDPRSVDAASNALLQSRLEEASQPHLTQLPIHRDRYRLIWPKKPGEHLSQNPMKYTEFAPLAAISNGVANIATAQRVQRYRMSDGARMAGVRLPVDSEYFEYTKAWRFPVVTNDNYCFTTYVHTYEPKQGRGYRGGVVRAPIPIRAIAGYRYTGDRKTLTKAWDSSESSDPLIKQLSFSSAPLLQGDRVLALGWRELGDVAVYLVAFEAESGNVLWSHLMGSNQIELTRFGELAEEPRLGDLCYHRGTVYVNSQLGFVAAVEAHSGNLDWTCVYQPDPKADSIIVRRRRRYPFESPTYWEQSHFLVRGNRVVINPRETADLLVLDARNGKLVFRRPESGRGRRPFFLVGLTDNDLLLCDQFRLERLPLLNLGAKPRSMPLAGSLLARPAHVRGGIVYTTPEGIFFAPEDFGRDDPNSKRKGAGSIRLHAFDPRRGEDQHGHVYVDGQRILVISSRRVQCFELSLIQ